MDRKAYLLSSLKKQVLQLKSQLHQIERSKNEHQGKRSRMASSSRFSSNSYDSSYLDRGVKKFPLRQQPKNLAEVISQKSHIEQKPKISKYRKA
jgi:hypothetical protein